MIKKYLFTMLTMSAVGALVVGVLNSVSAQDAPFGDSDSVSYSQKLWKAMEVGNAVGPNALISKPYKGQHPHGAVLDTVEGVLTVDGHAGKLIVKRNYGGEGLTIPMVGDDPNKHLKAVTVMFKREAGYDADNQDWFWAKYKPDGSLDVNSAGMKLAGRVAKGKPTAGCIACHRAAPGGNYKFNNNRQ